MARIQLEHRDPKFSRGAGDPCFLGLWLNSKCSKFGVCTMYSIGDTNSQSSDFSHMFVWLGARLSPSNNKESSLSCDHE